MDATTNIAKVGRRAAVALVVLGIGLAAALGARAVSAQGGANLPQGSEPVDLNPAEFTTRIDNPYWPMAPGNRWVYREKGGDGTTQRVVVKVLRRTRTIANGVRARVVRDTVTEGGELVEDTFDWYAQDAHGNVWYLGEDTREYENGRVSSTAGSFEAGVDGAQPGVIMPADPQVGLAYRQEYYDGEAEDKAAILSLGEKVTVPTGYYPRTLMTKDLVPLEPRVSEHKFYAEGVGPVLVVGTSGGAGREELVRFREAR